MKIALFLITIEVLLVRQWFKICSLKTIVLTDIHYRIILGGNEFNLTAADGAHTCGQTKSCDMKR